MYRRLNSGMLTDTIQLLRDRIRDRFPGASLGLVCEELLKLAGESRRRCEIIVRPNYFLRCLVFLVTSGIVVAIVYILFTLKAPGKNLDLEKFVTLVGAVLNLLLILGSAILSLVTVETRVKRNRTLKAIDELRSIAHVIDMHQLSKEPRILLTGHKKKSPLSLWRSRQGDKAMNEIELTRYLRYCTEMLSLVGKVAALYGSNFSDRVTLVSINEVEALTTGLSQKIWQKIRIVQLHADDSI